LGKYRPLAALTRFSTVDSFSPRLGRKASIRAIAASAAGHSTTADARRGRVISGAACAAPAATTNKLMTAPSFKDFPLGEMPHMIWPIEWRMISTE
jgi:hypothetical protein